MFQKSYWILTWSQCFKYFRRQKTCRAARAPQEKKKEAIGVWEVKLVKSKRRKIRNSFCKTSCDLFALWEAGDQNWMPFWKILVNQQVTDFNTKQLSVILEPVIYNSFILGTNPLNYSLSKKLALLMLYLQRTQSLNQVQSLPCSKTDKRVSLKINVTRCQYLFSYLHKVLVRMLIGW